MVEKQASASSESSNQTKLPPPVAPKPVIQNSSNNNEKKKVDASSINTSESAQVNGTRSSEESCVEEKSISASQVIHKIETQTRHSQQFSVSSNLFQDTVSSRLKKISAEEYSLLDRKTSLKQGSTETNETGANTDLCESTTKKLAANSVTEESSSTEKLNKLKNVSSTLSKQQTEVEEEITASSSTAYSSQSSSLKATEVCQSSSTVSSVANKNAGDDKTVKTTMVVRLHPGQSRRLSAFLDHKDGEVNGKSWLGDVQYDNNPSSICGLEISFSSVPQDIDIKLIPGSKFCNINNPDLITDSVGATLTSSEN